MPTIKMNENTAQILNVNLRFLNSSSLQDTLEAIVEEGMMLFRTDFGSVFLPNENKLERVYTSSPQFHSVKIRKRGYTYKAYRENKLFIVANEDFRKVHPKLHKMGMKMIVFIPLQYEKKSVGVLALESTRLIHYSEKDLNLIQLYGAMASLAIRKAKFESEITDALKLRDLFISMAAHELRTPLTSINGYIQLLHRKLKDENTIESRWMNSLYFESLRLTRLINELLEISRIQRGKLQYTFREVHLGDIIKRAKEDFLFSYPERKIVIADHLKNTDDTIVADFDKMIQVILNLLENAAKFSPPEKEIFVGLTGRGPYIEIQVKDQGIGIPKHDLPQVFKKFYRAGDSFQNGMGLGLYLAKSIVEKHHGTISISSRMRKGTTVEIKLRKVRDES